MMDFDLAPSPPRSMHSQPKTPSSKSKHSGNKVPKTPKHSRKKALVTKGITKPGAARQPKSTKAKDAKPVSKDGKSKPKKERVRLPKQPSILDDIDESKLHGQFTRALRFCKTVTDQVCEGGNGLVDSSSVENLPGVDLAGIDEITASIISDKVQCNKIRFSRRAVQMLRLINETRLKSKFDELKTFCSLMKKQTLGMDSVMASNLMHMHTNHAIEAMIAGTESDNAVTDRILTDNTEIYTKKNEAWNASLKCNELLGLDKNILFERARVLYGMDDKSAPWMQTP